jgi:SAM-dependent methyltransferase
VIFQGLLYSVNRENTGIDCQEEPVLRAYQKLARAYNDLMMDVDYDIWAAYINRLLGGKELHIYEAACGTGNITGRLYDMGHEIVASDISASMLDIATLEAKKNGREIIFIQQDMRKIEANGKFDAVVCACDGANYVDLPGLKSFANASFCLLKKGGKLLFDVSSSHKLTSMDDQVYFDDGDESTCIWHNHFNNRLKTLTMDVTLFVRKGVLYEKKSEKHIQFAHDINDVTRVIMDTGFSRIDAFKAFTMDAAEETCERIQFICYKE